MERKQPTSIVQWLSVYRLYESAFPREEKKPFSMIRSMYKKGKSDVWYLEEKGKFVGLVITINGPDKVLLDYLAVTKKYRGCGFGSETLQQMREQYTGKGVFLEIETVTEEAENYEERKRRKHFYLSNGMTELKVHVELFGVEMELLGYDCTLTFEEYHAFYRDNYNAWAAEHVKRAKESLVTAPPSKEIEEDFEAVKAE